MTTPATGANQPEQLGPYRIVRTLGHGGMGVVYEGVHETTNEPAAVKVLSASFSTNEGLRQRFEAEIDALRKLRHPNIVRLLGFGEQGGQLFYSMELVRGRSLEQEIRGGRRFHWREVVDIGIAVCTALRHAHDRGIIHRDIKPANLLLTPRGSIKLSDFGIAKLFGQTALTAAGNVLGTADYMAPEQADARPVGPRSDLYSLAAVLYTLLAGRPPLMAGSFVEMLRKQRTEIPPPVRRYAPDVPEEFESILAQLLEKDPQNRIGNATLLARRLVAMMHALTGTAEGETPSEALDRFSAGGEEDLGPTVADTPQPGVPVAADADSLVLKGDATISPTREATPEEVLPETRHTEAFEKYAPTETPGDEPPADRFTRVHEEELDRGDAEKPPSGVLISPHTWALVVALVALGLGAWYFLRPPSADRLYERIMRLTADKTIDSKRNAEGEIEEFLTRYSDDSRCWQLRQYQSDIDLARLERRFELWAGGRGEIGDLSPVERAYLEALNYLHLDTDVGTAKLRALIELYDNRPDPTKPFDTSGPRGKCLELARRRLARLQEQTAERHAQELALVAGQLDAADRLDATNPEKARTTREAVLELYRGKPWATSVLERAEQALAAAQPPADDEKPGTTKSPSVTTQTETEKR